MGTIEYRMMSNAEVDHHLARNQLARVIYSCCDKLDVELLPYAYVDGWLYGQTADQRALDMSEGGWWPVSIAVDEPVDGRSWRSVVVHGGFYTLDPNGSSWEREEASKALDLLNHRLGQRPEHQVGADQFYGRLFRVRVENVSGRTPVPGALEAMGVAEPSRLE